MRSLLFFTATSIVIASAAPGAARATTMTSSTSPILVFSQTRQTPTVPTCESLTLGDLVCAQLPHGVVIGDDETLAARFADVMRQGESRFRRYFGSEPLPYAVLVGDRANPVSDSGIAGAGNIELQARLAEAGALHVVPWFTAEQRARLRTAQFRQTAEARAKARGLHGDELTAAIEDSVAASERAAGPVVNADAGAAHELGHMWTISTFWPDYKRSETVHHYGGPAPDWFDETSAVLMEDDAMSAHRRDFFRTARSQTDGVRPKPLTAFFVDPHPNTSGNLLAPGAPSLDQLPPGARIVRAEDLPPGALPPTGASQPAGTSFRIAMASGIAGGVNRDEALMFYAQARVFADFLLEHTGEPEIYGRIAAAYAQGQTIEQWITEEGPALALGRSIEDLDRLWQNWVTQNYGPPG